MKEQSNIIQAMNNRYATKSFDPSRIVSQENMETILEAIRLSPSSFGLQPWKFFVIQSPKLKKQLGATIPLNQPKFETASHIIIFTRLNTLTKEYIDDYFELIKTARNQTNEDIQPFHKMISGKAEFLNDTQLNAWTSKQLYIALGVAVMSAALLGVDTCPMEGINPSAFDEILGIENSEYSSTVCLAVGYRSIDDSFANYDRVRFPKEQIITTL